MKLLFPDPDAITSKSQSMIYKFADNDFQEESNSTVCDVQTVTVLFEETKFRFDSLLLERNVGYFRKIIRQQPPCTASANKHVIIEMAEPKKVTVDAFRVIAIDFLKNKEVGLSTRKVGEILTAATFLEIPELREACHHFIALRPGRVLLSNVLKDKGFKVDMVRPIEMKKINMMLKSETCWKLFNYESQLNRYRVTHTGQRPFKCPDCHKAFTQRGNLKEHLLTHTGQKPFECSVCNKAFARSGDLNRHLQTHRGEKPFECPACHKAFSRNSSLKDHQLTHTDQKQYQCPTCHREFTTKKGVKRHILSHTKPFKCQTCHKSYSSRHSWKAHKCKLYY